jgi:ribosomal protein S27E
LKYNKTQEKQILEGKGNRKSNRQIARDLGISESGIRGFLERFDNPVTKPQGAKVLFYDIETSPTLNYTFGRFKQYIGQDNVVKEGGEILMASYRWSHEKETKFIGSIDKIRNGTNDAENAAELWELYQEATLVIGQNVKRFDHPMLQTSCLKAGLPPLPSVQFVDTLQIAKKKLRFASNKLDSLGAVLGLGRKQSHSGIDLWIRVMNGEKAAFEEMKSYCIQDTDLLVDVYNAMQSRGLVSSFNAANYYDDNEVRCPSCGSTDLEYTGRRITTGVSSFEEIRCNDCGTISRTRKNTNSKEKTEALIIRV